MPRSSFGGSLRTGARLVALVFVVQLLPGQTALRAKLHVAQQQGVGIEAALERASTLLGAGDAARAAAELQAARRAMDALRATVADATALRSVEDYLAPVLAQARRDAAKLKPRDRLVNERDCFSIVKVRIASVRPDSLEELTEGDPALLALYRVKCAIWGESQRVAARILEAPEVGAEAMPRTLRGRLFPGRKRRDLREGSTIELRLTPRKQGHMMPGADYWVVVSPATTTRLVPLLAGGAGRTYVLFAVRVE